MTLTPHGVPHPGLEPLCVISATLSALFATEQSSSVNKAVSLPCCLASSSILLLPSGQFSLLCIFSSRQLLERRFPKIHSRPVWFSRLSTFLFKYIFICIFCHRSFFLSRCTSYIQQIPVRFPHLFQRGHHLQHCYFGPKIYREMYAMLDVCQKKSKTYSQ